MNFFDEAGKVIPMVLAMAKDHHVTGHRCLNILYGVYALNKRVWYKVKTILRNG